MDEATILDQMNQQHGLISRRQALAAGMTDAQIGWRLRTGQWEGVGRGVYRHTVSPETPRSRLLAVCLACNGVASHRSAAALHGIDGYELDRIEVLVPWQRRPTIRGARFHRTTQMHLAKPIDRDGIPCTGIGRTVLDVAAVVDRKQLDHTIDAVLRQGLLRLSDLYTVLVTHSRQGRTGCGPFREALDERRGDDMIPLSAWSRMVSDLLADFGLERPVFEHRICDPSGELLAQVDLAYPSDRLAIELDSKRWHLNSVSFERDPRRRNALTVAGWTVLTFTWSDYVDRPNQLCNTVAELLAPGVRRAS